MMRPWRYAAVLAGGYALLAGGYIVLSDRIVGTAALSIEALAQVQLLKGLIFVVVTGLLLFGLGYFLFRRLARAADELAERREALVLAERRALVGTFAATLAHDFNNLLTVVAATADELRDLPELPKDAAELLDNVIATIGRGNELVRRLAYSGQEELGQLREVELVNVVREGIRLVRSHLKVKQTTVRFEGAGPITSVVYPSLIDQIVMNLVINAADALDGRGTIDVRVRAQNGEALIEVHDDGPGIPEAVRARALQAFFTTKSSGAGLGLASVRLCAEMHHGRVEIDDSPLGGACVRVFLPRRPAVESVRAAAS